MSQPPSPNRGSVADTLSALIQRIGRRNLRVRACDWSHPETPRRLTQIQETKNDAINPEIVMDRIVKLARHELRADGTGVWLFTGNETFFGAGAGHASNDERLRLALLSTLSSSWRLSDKGSLTHTGKPVASDGGIKSWLLEPLYQGRNVAGVLAAFSLRLDAFAEIDSAKIHSFADVLAQALTKAAAAGSAENSALEPASAMQLIEQMIPSLQRMVGSDESWTDSIGEFQNTDSDYDPFPPVSSAPLAEQRTAQDKTEPTTMQAATSLEADPAPSHLPDASLFSPDHLTKSGRANQMKSEREPAESSNPTEENRPNLSRAITFLKNYASRTLGRARVVKTWIVYLSALQSRVGLGALLTAAAVLVAVATIGFLALKTDPDLTQVVESGSDKPAPERRAEVADEQPTSPTYRETPQAEDVAPVATRQTQANGQPATSPPTQMTHLQVTDSNARSAVRTLSAYELAGLRRRALYGDDSAAFLIGMAYELGHGVRQDCKAAAQWVSNAAAEGNAVAQYNLGLRYRDGDGVPINPEAAMKWLQKAAGHKIPGAQMALVEVTSRQGQVAASRP